MKLVRPSIISGSLPAPPSKSMMIRALAASLLCRGTSRITNPSLCEDAAAARQVISTLGAHIESEGQDLVISGGLKPKAAGLNCGESGLCMRLFTPIAALLDTSIVLKGHGSLKSRPMTRMDTSLREMGAACSTDRGYPPIRVKGPLKSGKFTLDASLSSQFLTGLLFALPLCEVDSELTILNLKSKPYIAMTISLLKRYGINIQAEKDFKKLIVPGGQTYTAVSYQVEGDWSGAAFLLVAGAVGGEIEVLDLLPDSHQADKAILSALVSAGAVVSEGKNSVRVKHAHLQAFEFDATDCPDLFPPLAALACNCEGSSSIKGAERLKYKESDRGLALLSEFKKIGANIRISGDRMEIKGTRLKGGIIDSHNDHRIAMAGAVTALSSTHGVKIRDWEAVAKSYPRFFEDLNTAGGDVI